MTKHWVAVFAVLLAGSVAHAGHKDKEAATATFASCSSCTPTPAACSTCCTTTCGDCASVGHLAKIKNWLCYRPLERTCCNDCRRCECGYPLYLYFPPCKEGAGCLNYPSSCSSCNSCNTKTCGDSCHGGCASGFKLFRHASTCATSCESCK